MQSGEHGVASPTIPVYEVQQGEYVVSTDPARLDLEVIHGFLVHSYWSPGIPRPVVEVALRHSLCFGLYAGTRQIGLARVVTDYASFAYVADVFVLPAFRGQGLGTWLMRCVSECPALAQVRGVLLATRDAQGLYHKVGFETLSQPERWMVRWRRPTWYQPDLVVE
jgi:GNAT superfamily N-acetyltransferase